MRIQGPWMYERAKAHLIQSAETKYRVAEECLESIIKASTMIAAVLRAKNKLLLCGNGGSAADCQHIATEFLSTLSQNYRRPGLSAIALTTDTSFLTAYSNDYGFEGIFARQVETLGRAGDLLLGISTSGNSKNVIRAMVAAKKLEMQTVALIGNSGQLANLADIVISVPSNDSQHTQESHIAIGHILCDIVEQSLFKGE